MNKAFSATITTTGGMGYTGANLRKKLDPALAAIFDRNASEIARRVRPKVEAYMRTRVLPSYGEFEQRDMMASMRYRMDKRATGHSLSLHVAHPLLFAREFGVTVGGDTYWRPGPNKKALAIPFQRALMSRKLAPLVAVMQDRLYKSKEARNQRSKQNRADRERGVTPLRDVAPGQGVGYLFFKRLRVEASPFMGDVEAIMEAELAIQADRIVAAAAKSIEEIMRA